MEKLTGEHMKKLIGVYLCFIAESTSMWDYIMSTDTCTHIHTHIMYWVSVCERANCFKNVFPNYDDRSFEQDKNKNKFLPRLFILDSVLKVPVIERI